MGPVLGNLDPYSGTLNLTRTCLCTQVPKYNTLNWLNIDGMMQVKKKCQTCAVQMAKKPGVLFLLHTLSNQGGALP